MSKDMAEQAFVYSELAQNILFAIAIISCCLTVAGLIYSYLSYKKIEKVKEAQERYRKLVRINDIANLLNDLQSYLKDVEKVINNDSSMKGDMDQFQQEISKSLGSIESINKAFFGDNIVSVGPEFYEKGFFDDYFFRDKILCAKREIRICCKRNTRPFKQGNLHELVEKAENGVRIEVLAISSKISDELLEETRRSVPNPPKNVEEIRETQVKNRKSFLELKETMKNKENFKYYETIHLPLFHIIQVDDKFYWGLANYNKLSESTSEVYKNRPYLVFSIYDSFSKRMLQKFDLILEDCIEKNECY